MIEIYGSNDRLKCQVEAGSSSQQDKALQSDNVLSLSFTHYAFLELDVNDWCEFAGERYWLQEKYLPKQKNEHEWEYNVKLYGIESLIKRLLVLQNSDGENEAVFTLTAPASEHVRLIVESMNDGMDHTTNWKVGDVVATENLTIDYDGTYCDEGLRLVADAAGTEWWIEGETVNLCRCEQGAELLLRYGESLLSLDRDEADGVKFYTRLFPIGSSRNIDRSKYGSTRLQLPGGAKYVDIPDLVERYGVFHHYEQEAFSGIYPRRVGVISSVRWEEVKDPDGNPFTIWYFKDNGLTFDPNAYEIGGLVKHVSFQSGELEGRDFEVNFNSQTREFEIITTWPYDDDMQLPDAHGGHLVPAPGNTYILWNISMPDEYYDLAEKEYQSAVEAFNREHLLDKGVYKAPTNPKWVERSGAQLYVGRRVRLESQKYFPKLGYRSSRITRLTRKVSDPYQIDLEISDAVSTGTMTKIEDSIHDVKMYVRESSSVLPDIIRSWESTKPTDTNVMSARKVDQDYLSKKKGGRVLEDVTFDKDVAVGGDVDVDGTTTLNGELDAKSPVLHESTTTHNGQTTHNAKAVFKQHFDVPNESVGRIAGTLHFANTIEQAGTAQPNGSISGTGIAQLKKMTLTGPDTAGQYDTLDVKGTSLMRDIIGPYSASVRFEDGFTGHGFRIWKDENNAYHITADFLTIRQQMKVFELLIQKIRSTAGSIVVSDANGKIKRVKEMTIASENDTWLIWFETDHDFAAGDIMRVQSWKGLGTSAGSYGNTSWWGVVGAVQTIDGEKIVVMSKSTWSGNEPKEGDEVVQWGNTGVTPGRDKILYLTAAENDTMGISMYEGVDTINGGTLTLKIGDLEGINTSTFGDLHGWGLYAQSVYLESDNIAGSDGKTISQRFQVADGKLESAIDGMRAKTSGDSIVRNHDLADVTEGYPDYWHPYNIDGTLLSDTTSILSDGHTALGAYGTGEAYTAYFDDGVNRYLRIINGGESADCGFYQNVGDMNTDLWKSGESHKAKTVEFRFRYRLASGSSLKVYFHSGFMSGEGNCDSDYTSQTYTLYGLKKALTADGKWHTATYYGTFIGGSGELRFLAKGTADVTDVECLVAESIQFTNSRFEQTDTRITLEVQSLTNYVDGQDTMLNGRISTEAGRISALATRMTTAEGDITSLKTSGFVARSEFAGLFTTNLHGTEGFYDVTTDPDTGLPVYTLKLINLQTAAEAAQAEITDYITNYLDADLIDRNVARRGDWNSDVNKLRSDTLSTFVSGSELTAQLSGYYEKDSNGKLIYWTTEDEDYNASDWGNPTSTPTEGKAYFIVTYTDGGVTTHRLAVYDKWAMSDPAARVVEFVPKFTIKAQISTFLSFKHDENGAPIYARDENGNIIYIDGVPQREVEGNVMMKADNIIQIAQKIQAVVSQMSITADTIEIHDPATNEKTLWINGNGNVTMRGVLLNLIQSIDSSSNLIISNSEETEDEQCNPECTVWPGQGSDFDSLDFLMMGDTIKMTNDKGHGFIVPFYIANVNQDTNECYARTWTRYGGTLHKITTDELLMFVGRRYNIIMSSYTTSTNRYLWVPELIEVSDGSVTSPNGVSTIQYRGIQLGVQQVISLEFRMGRFRYTVSGSNYHYSPCFYFKIVDTAGQLPNWT